MNLRANSGPMAALTRPGHFAAPRAERAIAPQAVTLRTSRMRVCPFPPLFPSGEGAAIDQGALLETCHSAAHCGLS